MTCRYGHVPGDCHPLCDAPTPAADPAPTCATCNDTHRMKLGEREVMCTSCPVPCEKCQLVAYCKTSPCSCGCHSRANPAPKTVPTCSCPMTNEAGRTSITRSPTCRVHGDPAPKDDVVGRLLSRLEPRGMLAKPADPAPERRMDDETVKAAVDRANATLAQARDGWPGFSGHGRTRTLARRLAASVLSLEQQLAAALQRAEEATKEVARLSPFVGLLESRLEEAEDNLRYWQDECEFAESKNSEHAARAESAEALSRELAVVLVKTRARVSSMRPAAGDHRYATLTIEEIDAALSRVRGSEKT